MDKKILLEVEDFEKIVKYFMRVNVGYEALEEAAEVKKILTAAKVYNITDNSKTENNGSK